MKKYYFAVKHIFLIFALTITHYNAKSENIYLKNSPARSCILPVVNSIVIGDSPSSTGLTLFQMNGKKLTTQEFIIKAIDKHGDTYDYSLVNVNDEGVYKKVAIICKIHGVFYQSYRLHVERKCGCRKCGRVSQAKNKTTSKDDFIRRSNIIHNNKYKYFIENEKINLREDKIKIECPIHGVFFQVARQHLNQKQGCKQCGVKNILSTDDFIEKSKRLFPNLFLYTDTKYNRCREEILITCKKHGIINIKPNDHFRVGCMLCHHNRMEHIWLNENGVPDTKETRQVRLIMKNMEKGKYLKVDGFNPLTNTVYLFHGDFWHGNPKIYDSNKINAKNNKTFGYLYNETILYENRLKENGYNIISIWEYDFLQSRKT